MFPFYQSSLYQSPVPAPPFFQPPPVYAPSFFFPDYPPPPPFIPTVSTGTAAPFSHNNNNSLPIAGAQQNLFPVNPFLDTPLIGTHLAQQFQQQQQPPMFLPPQPTGQNDWRFYPGGRPPIGDTLRTKKILSIRKPIEKDPSNPVLCHQSSSEVGLEGDHRGEEDHSTGKDEDDDGWWWCDEVVDSPGAEESSANDADVEENGDGDGQPTLHVQPSPEPIIDDDDDQAKRWFPNRRSLSADSAKENEIAVEAKTDHQPESGTLPPPPVEQPKAPSVSIKPVVEKPFNRYLICFKEDFMASKKTRGRRAEKTKKEEDVIETTETAILKAFLPAAKTPTDVDVGAELAEVFSYQYSSSLATTIRDSSCSTTFSEGGDILEVDTSFAAKTKTMEEEWGSRPNSTAAVQSPPPSPLMTFWGASGQTQTGDGEQGMPFHQDNNHNNP